MTDWLPNYTILSRSKPTRLQKSASQLQRKHSDLIKISHDCIAITQSSLKVSSTLLIPTQTFFLHFQSITSSNLSIIVENFHVAQLGSSLRRTRSRTDFSFDELTNGSSSNLQLWHHHRHRRSLSSPWQVPTPKAALDWAMSIQIPAIAFHTPVDVVSLRPPSPRSFLLETRRSPRVRYDDDAESIESRLKSSWN